MKIKISTRQGTFIHERGDESVDFDHAVRLMDELEDDIRCGRHVLATHYLHDSKGDKRLMRLRWSQVGNLESVDPVKLED